MASSLLHVGFFVERRNEHGEKKRKQRRGNNEGTIYQRKDGLWCARITLNVRRLTKYAKQRSECYLWIRETLGRIHAGLSFEGIRMTLDGYVETWLKGKELARKPKTVEQYA